jgi:hypothetical protein
VDIEEAAPDLDIEPDQELTVFADNKVRLTRYYGLVPRHLLDEAMKEQDDEEVAELVDEDEDDSYYVEAVIIIANNGTLLKALC